MRSVPRDLPRGEVPDAARPPLGCSFHPRCPRPSKSAAGRARDLRDLLEMRWAQMQTGGFESEQAVFGDLDALDKPATKARLSSAGGETRARSTNPGRGSGRAVLERRPPPGDSGPSADIEWHDPVEPRLQPVGDVNVECHLYGVPESDESPGTPGSR